MITINCDMCGKESKLFKTDVEGSALNLCSECAKFGKVISVVRGEKKEPKKKIEIIEPKESETILVVVSDYGDIIKKKREELGVNQEEFAKKLSEKASLIHKLEINQFEPSIKLCRKIEKLLHVKLIEQQELESIGLEKSKGEHLTIGDLIKIKK